MVISCVKVSKLLILCDDLPEVYVVAGGTTLILNDDDRKH